MEMSNPAMLRQLTEVNAQAFDKLCEGFHDEATQTMKQVLVIALQGMAAQNTMIDAPATVPLRPFLVDIPLMDAILPQDFVTDHPACFPLYASAFGAENDTLPDFRSLVAVVMYNLALIHHQLGLLEGHLPRLLRAQVMYQRVLDYMTAAARPTHHHDDRHAVKLLLVAAVNNMGHIASFLGDKQGVQDCVYAMRAHLAGCPPEALPWFRASVNQAEQSHVTFAPMA